MIGSDKQIKWALSIQQEFRERYPDEGLPDNPYAQFWIEHRKMPLDELWQTHNTCISSPCTKTYPKIMRSDIEPLLMNMRSFAVFDTETSGLLKHKKSEIVEIAIVTVETGEILLNTLFKPKDMEFYLQSEARAMHAFAEEEYHQAHTFPETWKDIQSILSSYHLVAYNADFDVPMLMRTAHIWGLSFPRVKTTCAMELWQAFMTTESTSRENYKLSEACEIAGICQESYGTPHTALADAFVTRELLLRMQRCLYGDTSWNTCMYIESPF